MAVPSALVDSFVEAVAQRTAELVLERQAERPAVERAGFSPREAGQYLGVSERHVRSMIDAGDIKAGRLGTRVLIHRAELDRVLRGEAA